MPCGGAKVCEGEGAAKRQKKTLQACVAAHDLLGAHRELRGKPGASVVGASLQSAARDGLADMAQLLVDHVRCPLDRCPQCAFSAARE